MKKTNKKGFTIVELVIVIAVVAILAAVLIPTFVSVTKRANESADIQACRQMNTILATYVDGSVTTVEDAVAALDKENIDIEDYKALQKDHYFYFTTDANGNGVVIYADKDGNVVYPEGTYTNQRMSLSGDVPLDSNYKIEDNTVVIDSGAKLAHLIENKKNTSDELLTVTLKGEIDLMGAAVDFGKVTKEIIIEGEGEDAVLKGLRASDYCISPTSGEFAGHKYGYGLFGSIEKDATVTIKDVEISGFVVGNAEGDHANSANTIGLIAGYVRGILNMENVKIENCAVYGYQKVGGIAGRTEGANASITLDNVTMNNVNVYGSIETATVVGYLDKGNLTVTGGDLKAEVHSMETYIIGHSDYTWSGGKFAGDSKNKFRVFNESKIIFASITNDWAWYKGVTGVVKVTVDGEEIDVNGIQSSASKNFVNGQPTDN